MGILALVVGIAIGMMLAMWLGLSRTSSPKTYETIDPNTPRNYGMPYCRIGGCLEQHMDDWAYCRKHLISLGYFTIKPYEFDFAHKPPALMAWSE